MAEPSRGGPFPGSQAARPQHVGVIQIFARRFNLDPGRVLDVLRGSCFSVRKDEAPFSNEEIAAALIICNQYDLSPFAGHVACFRGKGGKIRAFVTIDGWAHIANRHPEFEGVELEEHNDEEGGLVAVTCRMWRRGVSRPMVLTERLDECREDTDPWRKRPRRMLRHRAFGQAARYIFGATARGGEVGLPEPAADTYSVSAPVSAPAALPAPGRGRMAWTPPAPQREEVPAAAPAEPAEPVAAEARAPGQEG